MTKQILLSRGLFATVDDADYDWLSQWKWSAMQVSKAHTSRFYAVRMTRKGEVIGSPKMILMHRTITDAPRGMVVDHLDNNGLNNVRANVRACTQSENMMNSVGHRNGSSQYKGVWFHKQNGNWCSQFRNKGLGSFTNEEDAARAYDKAALAFSPIYARLNFDREAA